MFDTIDQSYLDFEEGASYEELLKLNNPEAYQNLVNQGTPKKIDKKKIVTSNSYELYDRYGLDCVALGYLFEISNGLEDFLTFEEAMDSLFEGLE